MTLLIDGYNLLHAAGIFPQSGPPTLERARSALLDFLVQSLPAKQIARTIVVFDASHAPPGLPRELDHLGLAVRFAPRGSSADALLEELIAAEPDARHLLVVSSDHRVQRAARQRGANYIDSEAWRADLARAQKSKSDSRQVPPAASESKQESPLIQNPFPPGYASDVLDDPEA
jgi:predicted RNA-binding protein with PIN domain